LINRTTKFFICPVLVLITLAVHAQDKYTQQGSYWIRYYNQSQISDRTVIHFQVDERRLLNPSRQFQFFTHLNINCRMKSWLEVGAGLNFNWTNVKDLKVPEWRPWQEANIILPMPREWQFQFRYRLDERIIHNNNKVVLTDGYGFYLRHRFRVQFSRELKKISETKSLSMRLSNEFMVNTGDAPFTFDQNRVYAGLEYRFSKHWSVETGYLNIFQSRTDDSYYIRHTIRVTVYHKLDFRRPVKGEQ